MVVIAALTGAVILMVNIVTKLIDPGLTTNIDVEAPSDEGIPFPSFTICNYNQHKKSYVDKHPEFKYYQAKWYPYHHAFIFTDKEEKDEILKMDIDLSQVDIDKHFRNAIPTKEETLYFIVWGVSREVNVSKHFQSVVTDHGICYTFTGDPDEPFFSQATGKADGFTMYVLSTSNDYAYNMISNGAEGIRVRNITDKYSNKIHTLMNKQILKCYRCKLDDKFIL